VAISTRLVSDITRALRAAPHPEVAHEATLIWQTLARKFVPLIGPSSVQLIVGRCIESSQSSFPWPAPFSSPGMATPPYDGLRAAFEHARAEAVLAVTSAMLTTYISQLNILIGARLAEQFLRAIFPAPADTKDTRSKSE
jgi:hypothetical protein